jgi:hypothetical protein
MTRLIGIFALYLTLAMAGGMVLAYGDPSEKYQVLFAVDRSRSMSRYSAMTRQTVFDLVYDGVQGQMNTGDLYGIWIFNEKVQTNVFTAMNWDAQLNHGLATGAANFIKSLRYEKGTKLDRLWAELVGYVRGTKKLTFILITDGTDRFVGTPFDTQINTYFEKHSKEYRQAKKPFVITLAALDGKFLACTVNGARDPIAFDSIASQVYEWKQSQPQYQALQNKQAAPVAIKEVSEAPVIAPRPEILPPTGPAAVGVIQTNADVQKAVIEPARTEMTPQVTVKPTPAPSAAVPGPGSPIPAPALSETVAPGATKPGIAPSSIRTNAPAEPAAMPSPTKPVPEVAAVPAAPQNAHSETPTNALKVVAAPAPSDEKQPVRPAAVVVRPGELAPTTPVASKETEVKAPIVAQNQTDDHLKNTSAGAVAKPVSASRHGSRTSQYLIGSAIVLLVAAMGLAVGVIRRFRRRPTASFISQSIDRESRP